MKKTGLLLLVFILFLTSCSLGGSNMNSPRKTDRQIANNTLEQLLVAIQQKEENAIKNLFSKRVIDEVNKFDEYILDLLDFFEGEVVAFDDWAGVGMDNLIECGKIRTELQSTYDVETSKQKYHIAIKECTVDTFDSDNVGVTSVYIIHAEDWKEIFAYRGDGKWTPGINIETNSK